MSYSHPLIGWLVKFDVDDGKSLCVSQFVADLGDGLMLARRLGPSSGNLLDMWHVIVLREMTDKSGHDISFHPDFDAYRTEWQHRDCEGSA